MSSKERGLHDLLEGFCVAHKNDIDVICSGHLNHNRLQRPKETVSHQSWQSYSKDVPLLRQPSKLPSPRKSVEKDKTMSKALYDFSVGTSGSLPLPAIHKKPKAAELSKAEVHTNREKATASRLRPNSIASYLSDNMYIEELEIPDLMLPSSGTSNHRKSQQTEHSIVQNERREKYEKRQFLTTHLGAITKRDQFTKMREFDNTILRKPEMREQEVLSGRQAVQHLEQKLYQNLHELGSIINSPNFHRLRVYSGIWDDLIQDTPTFSKILKAIKIEYDTYMGSLLDTQPQQQSQVLYNQVRGLAASGTSIPGQVKHEQDTVQQMELKAKQILEENQRLRGSVETERQDLMTESLPNRKPTKPTETKNSRDLAIESFEDQITALHIGILELVEDMKETRQQIQRNYVPSAVCKHLEHGVKEMEIAVLKVLSTNEYLEKTIQQLEIDIEKVMEKTGIEDAECRQVWKAINTLSVPMEEEDSTPR